MINVTLLADYIDTYKFGKNPGLSIFSLPGSGVSMVLKNISEEKSDTLYIDCSEIGRISEKNAARHLYYELSRFFKDKNLTDKMNKEIQSKDYYEIYRDIKELVQNIKKDSKNSKEVIIIFDKFDNWVKLDKYFLVALFGILTMKNEIKIDVIFSMYRPISENEIIHNAGELSKLILSKIEYVRGFKSVEIKKVLDPISKNSEFLANFILENSAGDPDLVDRMLDLIGAKIKLNNNLNVTDLNSYEIAKDNLIKLTSKSIIDAIGSEAMNAMVSMSFKNLDDYMMSYLVGTWMISLTKGGEYISNAKLLTPLKEKQMLASKKESPTKENFFNSAPTDELSTQEYEVFKLFENSKGKVVTKEDISKVIWGKNGKKSKKSDWAIDQLMKRMRTKLGDDKGKVIKTVRGRGYRVLI
ncbi:MAG TPA: helix-turn-helix domain-containing protein [Candidatus Dojkabacteria bacterium]|jgi:hypothetical protein